MVKKMTFAEQVLQFNDSLSQRMLAVPAGFKVINPFEGNQREQVRRVATAFYQKYYSDSYPRRLIVGSSPARRGTAVTGVPFEDARYLRSETGIYIDKFFINQSSSGFMQDAVRKYGGCEKFYTDFYMNFVCPLAVVRINAHGREVNCNYYEDKKLQEILHPFIVNTIHSQIGFGIDTSLCYCIGSGENYSFLSKINREYKFFDTIIPLEHPRFIMQYNSERRDMFIEKYVNARGSTGSSLKIDPL